ncbi:hypothetical protein JWG42_05430 [Desulfoprunum benzoelyticum]|uniref:Uncharacterized protein n=1 Tax=Desulfoprunum benzoelyticum TaxID=1506996 RepID=A0A840URE2_9BACT|nr:hypothetical protein [Desulfoprunum benzoelyticum]MBB5348215.1 hypothetical protein [Desulfoprunum benzoelyticum]MBM9529593.1 hypothetical protein [Desulfoprunum benzoelyticum]
MEPIEFFTTAVLTICGIHLASVAGTRLQSWWMKTTGRKKPAVTTGRQRSDWYAFFHCADLVGKEPAPKHGAPGVGSTTGVVGKRVAPVARRPDTRLRLS